MAPDSGDIKCSLGEDGDTCTFTCEVGYKLNGSATRTCMIGNSWSGDETKCDHGKLKYLLLTT